MKVNVLHDIIKYYVRVNQDKEVNMQHPKDVKGSDRPLLSIPVGQRYTTILGRFDALDIKVRHLEDRARTQRDESDHIVDVVGHLESDVSDLDGCYSDVVPRLDAIELEVEVMNKVVTKNALALCEIEERIAIMQEKIDGIN